MQVQLSIGQHTFRTRCVLVTTAEPWSRAALAAEGHGGVFPGESRFAPVPITCAS